MVLPSGMVTFLFTDIEGSSAMWDRAREEMAAAVAHHDAILDRAVTAHMGHVVKKLGDGLLAVFADPADAIAGAVEAQRSIAGVE